MALEKVNRGFQRLLKGRAITILLLIAFGLVATTGRAACTGSVWNLGAAGNWNVAGNWNPSGVPNGSSTNVCIVDGSSTVSLTNLSPTTGDLTLASGNALDISSGLALSVAGTTISNAGTITLNGGGGANGFINIEGNVTLSGGGTKKNRRVLACLPAESRGGISSGPAAFNTCIDPRPRRSNETELRPVTPQSATVHSADESNGQVLSDQFSFD